MRAVRARHAQGAQPAQGQAGSRCSRPRTGAGRAPPRYDRIGIEAERAQGRGDLLGHAEVDVAGRQRPERAAVRMGCVAEGCGRPIRVGRGTIACSSPFQPRLVQTPQKIISHPHNRRNGRPQL